jgi:hypothetical protein
LMREANVLSFWILCGTVEGICELTDGTDSNVVGGIANLDKVAGKRE